MQNQIHDFVSFLILSCVVSILPSLINMLFVVYRDRRTINIAQWVSCQLLIDLKPVVFISLMILHAYLLVYEYKISLEPNNHYLPPHLQPPLQTSPVYAQETDEYYVPPTHSQVGAEEESGRFRQPHQSVQYMASSPQPHVQVATAISTGYDADKKQNKRYRLCSNQFPSTSFHQADQERRH